MLSSKIAVESGSMCASAAQRMAGTLSFQGIVCLEEASVFIGSYDAHRNYSAHCECIADVCFKEVVWSNTNNCNLLFT